jgi:2-polyprenyl-3-methyl-5-hydroxy-6-metoxy-1,4-benzoquinol methylase
LQTRSRIIIRKMLTCGIKEMFKVITLNDEQASFGIHDELLKIIQTEPHGKLLDVGCGAGALASRLKKSGMDVWVVELSADFVRYPGLHITERNLDAIESLPYPNDYFDYIVMCEVIEHIRHPFFLIGELSRILKPGGKIYITTPNIHHIKSKVKFLFHNDFYGFNEEQQTSPLSHLLSFSRRQLKLILNENGISPIDIKYSNSFWGRRVYLSEIFQNDRKIHHIRKYIVKNLQYIECSIISLFLTSSFNTKNINFGESIIVIGKKYRDKLSK